MHRYGKVIHYHYFFGNAAEIPENTTIGTIPQNFRPGNHVIARPSGLTSGAVGIDTEGRFWYFGPKITAINTQLIFSACGLMA